MVITDHGSVAHAKIGVDKVNPDIVAAREELTTPDFQGLEWNIPAAEHGTVFVHPGSNEVACSSSSRTDFDGSVKNRATTPRQRGARHRRHQVPRRRRSSAARSQDALFLANHPARKGIDSPHEIRNWRDADPTVAIGMEGAPGHQAAGIPAPNGRGGGARLLRQQPVAASFPATRWRATAPGAASTG
jgi:hypothetical protein